MNWSNEKDNCNCQANNCFFLLIGSTTGRNGVGLFLFQLNATL